MAKRVGVVGAGIGGLACGALLAKEGYEVRVFEKNAFIGGRCSAAEKGGFTVDNFVHAFPLGGSGPHARVAEALGETIEFITRDPAALVVDGLGGAIRKYPQRLNIRPLLNRYRMARDIGVKTGKYPGGYSLLRDMLRADHEFIRTRDRRSIRDFLYEYTDDEQLHRFMNFLGYMMFVIPYDEASAGEFIYCFREMFNAASFGYVRGSSGAIPEAYRRGLEKFGGKLALERPVQRILCDNGRVEALLSEGEELPVDIVVSNAGISTTVQLAGAESLGSEYAGSASGLKYSESAVLVKYFLDRRVLEVPFLTYIPDSPADRMFSFLREGGLPTDVWIFMPVIDRWDPDLVPAGRQLLIAATAAPSGAGEEQARALADMMEDRIFYMFPEVKKHIASREEVLPDSISAASGHRDSTDCIGLAQSVGQVGDERPSPLTPVKGLYLAGADAGARGIGTELAAASGEALARLVRLKEPNED